MVFSMTERQAVLRELTERYRRAGKKERGTILDECVALCGYSRSYAGRCLRYLVLHGVAKKPSKRHRKATYWS